MALLDLIMKTGQAIAKGVKAAGVSGASSGTTSPSTMGSAGGTLESLQAQKDANSAAWHTATTQAEKDKLHQDNVLLSQKMDAITGGTSTFDPATGKWSTTPDPTPTVKSYDNSSYLRKQSAAEVEAALADLKGAYARGIAAYDAQQDKLPERYRAAMNSAAAQSAMAKKAFDEQAAASGLNSGASGQAALDASAVYQGNISNLQQSKASDMAEIDRAKADLTAQYESAVAKAKAEGNAELAKAIYQEMIRVQGLEREDEQIAYDRGRDALSDSRYMEERDYQREQDAYNRQWNEDDRAYQRKREEDQTAYDRAWQQKLFDTERDDVAYEREWNEDERAYQRGQDAYNQKLQAAETMAESGNFKGYAELWGLDEQTVTAMVDRYAQQEQMTKTQAARDLADWYAQYGDFSKLKGLGVNTSTLEKQQALAVAGKTSSSRSGSSGSGGSGNTKKQSKTLTYQDLYDSGARSEGDAYNLLLNAGYSSTEAKASAEYFMDYLDDLNKKPTPTLQSDSVAQSLKERLRANIPQDRKIDAIQGALDTHSISEEEAQELMRFIGFDDATLAKYGF